MGARRTHRFLILSVLVAMAAALLLPAPALALDPPMVDDAVSAPNIVSVFGDISAAGATPDSPLGPGWTNLVVKLSGGTATTVTLDLKELLLSLLPVDMDPMHASYATGRIPSANRAAWEAYLTGLATTPMSYDGVGAIWRYAFTLDSLLSPLGFHVGTTAASRVILEDLRPGAKTVAATASNAAGAATGTISLWIVDAQIPLRQGWNAFSSPFKMTALYTPPAGTIDVMVRWDSATQLWALLGAVSEVLDRSPLEAFFLHSVAAAKIGANLSRNLSSPPSRALPAGSWNLVGSAPDFGLDLGPYYPKTGTGAKMRGLMKADAHFLTLKNGPNWGGTILMSIGQQVSFTSSYMYGAYSLGNSYPWLFGQPNWTYTSTYPAPLSDPVTPGLYGDYRGWVVPFGAYWVYTVAAADLAGFTRTPIPLEWLTQARTLLGL